MNILILGAGQVGSALAKSLANSDDNNITIIDINSDTLIDLSRHLDIKTITGVASYPKVLEEGGIKEADILIAVTQSDESNMVACQMAHVLYKVQKKIARIRSSEYLHYQKLFSADAIPIDFIISPEILVTNYLKRIIEVPGVTQILEFEDGLIQLVETRAFAGTPIVGLPIKDLHQHLPGTKVRIVSVNRGVKEIDVCSDTIIKHGDKIFFITEKNSVNKALKEFRRLDRPYKNIIIAGGGRIGFGLALFLEKNHNVRIIEKNPIQAKTIEARLNNSLVLNGNASDEELLLDEGIKNTDLFLALTDTDEINLITAILAKRLGAHKVIALVKRNIYEELVARNRYIDMILSPDKITSGGILAHIRKGNTMMIKPMRHNKSEAVEIIINEDASVVGKNIQDIQMPDGVEIGSIVRNNELLMPSKKHTIYAKDHILLIITDLSKASFVEKIFASKN